MNDSLLVDFHCHLDLYPDMRAAYERCEQMRCTTFAVTTTPKAFARNFEYSARTKHVRAALGLHPQVVAGRHHEIELFEKLSFETRYIGEIGLDASRRHYSSFDKQKQVFDRALKICARQGSKIISVHSARCARQVLNAIENSSVNTTCKIVLHWFSANNTDIDRAIRMGCWFSLNQKMLSSPTGLALIGRAPLDRLLTETDAPFMKIEGVDVEAGDVAGAISMISFHLGMTCDEVQKTISINADRVLEEHS